MSESKQPAAMMPSSDTPQEVNVVERLKAYMNESAEEPTDESKDPSAVASTTASPAPGESVEEDELAVLLREQLAKQAAMNAAPTPEDNATEESAAQEPEPRPVTVDSLLNGLSPDEPVGGARLRQLDVENAALLRETVNDQPVRTEMAGDGNVESTVSADSADDMTAPHDPPHRESSAPSARTGQAGHDPMQMGLDDLFPRTHTADDAQAATPNIAPGYVRPAADTYTDRMSHADGVEERDTDLYVRLGYESTLRRAEEQERVERVRERQMSAAGSAAVSKHEYVSAAQNDAIEAAYARARVGQLVRLLVALAGAWIALLYDLLPTLLSATDTLASFLRSPAYPLIGLAWIALICLPFLTRLGRGLRSVWDFEPTRYAVAAIGLVVTAVHGGLSCLPSLRGQLSLFGGVALLMLAVVALCEYLGTTGEHAAFTVVSCGKPAFVLTDEPTPAACAAEDASTNDAEGTGGSVDGKKASTGSREPLSDVCFTAVRCGRVADYFARSERYNPYMGRLNYLLPAALLAAILCAGLTVALGGAFLPDAVQVFTATCLSCLPAGYLVAMSWPLCRANRALMKKGTAVIGTAAPSDYAAQPGARLIFTDGSALSALRRKEIHLRDDPDADTWRHIAARLFRVLDCPLATESLFGNDDFEDDHAEIVEVGARYIKLCFTGRNGDGFRETTEITMGSHEALVRRGIRLPKIGMERLYKKSEESEVLYLAFDGKFRLAYAMEYRVAQSFVRALNGLSELGHPVSVAGYDPLVTSDALASLIQSEQAAVEVLRPAYIETVRKSRSSGVLATGRPLDLLYPYAACHRMRQAYRAGQAVAWLGMLIGLLLSVASILLDGGYIWMSAAVTIVQTVMALAMAVVSLVAVNRRTMLMKKEKECK